MEEGYSGPRWEEGELSSEFMSDLLQWLKDEKKLHRKYAYKVSGQERWRRGEREGQGERGKVRGRGEGMAMSCCFSVG